MMLTSAVAAVVVPEPARHAERVRRDQRDIRARPAAGAVRVLQRRLDERAVLAVKQALARLQIPGRGPLAPRR